MNRIIIFLFFGAVLQGCKAYRPITDIGKQDLFTNGLSPDYNNSLHRNYILDIKPEQIFRDTIFRHIHSKIFTTIREEDSAVGLEKPHVYPSSSSNIYLDNNGYILKEQIAFENRDTIWNTTSFSYTFAKSKLTQVIRYTSRFKTEDTKYTMNYNRRGLIARIIIANQRDSLIIQRTYHYSHRKLATYTINGNRDTIEHKEYVFGRNNKVIEQTTHLILEGTVKKSKAEYKNDSGSTTKWDESDKNGQIIASGYERYLNGLILESESNFYGNWEHKDYVRNVYNDNRLLSNTTRIYSSPSQTDTTVTTYTYQIDFKNRIRKTVTEDDCSKCKSCSNCESVRTEIVKYE